MELFGYFRKKELIFWKNCTIFNKTTKTQEHFGKMSTCKLTKQRK